SENFWKTIIRQATVQNYLQKDIETYGVLKITEKGQKVISGKDKTPFMIAEDRQYDLAQTKADSEQPQPGSSLDEVMFANLKELLADVGKIHDVPPYTVFMDPSLEDMLVQYPTTIEEMARIYSVGEGKAKRYVKEFLEYINKYVE